MFRFNNQKQQKRITTGAISSEQSDSHHATKDKLTNLDINDHDQVEKEITYTSFESDSTITNYNNFQLDFADKNHLKRYAHEIIDYTATEIEIKHNGAILFTPHFRQLPSELVSLIVGYCLEQHDLYALSLVNKQFHAIANPLLWRTPKLIHETAVVKFLNSISKLPSPTRLFIRKMELLSVMFWNKVRFSLLLPHLCHLEELTIISDESIKDTSVTQFPHHCPNLTSLELDCLGISDTLFTALGENCHQLRQLTLTFSLYQSSYSLDLLVPCPLQKLTLTFHPRCYYLRRRRDMIRGLTKFTLLTHLVMNDLYAGHGRLLFQRNGSIDPPWPRLSLLHVDSCENLSDSDLIPFVNSHPHLMDLRLGHVNIITDRSLLAIGSALSCLTTLYLHYNRHISEDGLFKLIRNCRQLTFLTLDHCDRIARNKMELDQNALDSIREGCITTINH
ncbi:unnamed protein product [Absidia cylindrospora]